MFVAGLDIGYSNFKLCCGEHNASMADLQTLVLPSTAAPLKDYNEPAIASGGSADGVRVVHGGADWIACVDPARLSFYTRELDANYHCSDAYLVMFKAALSLMGRDVVDMLVVGLPDEQSQNEGLRRSLEASLSGTHQVSRSKKVRVENVQVISQPLGGYMQLVMMASQNPQLEQRLLQSKALIVDPGFYSFDWITLTRGAYTEGARGTSMRATSVFLESVSRSIAKAVGGRISIAQLEHALREGWDSVFVSGKQVVLAPHFEAGVQETAANAVAELSGSLRRIDGTQEIGVVMTVGGGARMFEPALRRLLPNQMFVVPREPVAAIAVGFYLHGRGAATKLMAA